jgi:hypothetical protein
VTPNEGIVMIGSEMARERISDRVREADAERRSASIRGQRRAAPRRRRHPFAAIVAALTPGRRRAVESLR